MDRPAPPAPNRTPAWGRLSLTVRFAVTGGVVMLIGMAAIGTWVAAQIQGGVTRNTATGTALYVDSFIAPLVQELADSDRLSPATTRAIDDLFGNTPLGRRVVSFKIWRRDGTIVHASLAEIRGKAFTPTDTLRAAWAGAVVAEFDDLGDAENVTEQARGLPLLEIYSPIRRAGTDETIAVAEFYENATALERDLYRARTYSWAVVGAVTLAMFAGLSGIVRRGSQMIEAQRRDLADRVVRLSELADQNERLRRRVQRAANRVTEVNEDYLRRISADLHDGPAQLLAFAALRLDSLAQAQDPDQRAAEVAAVRGVIADALRDVRNLCRGLVLPELEPLDLDQILHRAVEAHRRATDTAVTLVAPGPGPDIPAAWKICVYRFVQEGLSNATRHGAGRGQVVTCTRGAAGLRVCVSDTGPGLGADPGARGGLGLAGLRDRVESLGGQFSLTDAVPRGTELCMTLGQEGAA